MPNEPLNTGAHILLVDEHRVTLNIDQQLFMEAGFSVFTAQTPENALEILAHTPIHLLILDVSPSKEEILSTISTFKRTSVNPKLKVLVTSVIYEIKKKAELKGADGFLHKPVPRPKLLKEVKKLVEMQARDSERIIQELPILLRTEQGEWQVRSLDISADGIHLTGVAAPPIGTQVSMTLKLSQENTLSLNGTVVRHTQQGFGVKFAPMTKTTKRHLDKFLLANSIENHLATYYL